MQNCIKMHLPNYFEGFEQPIETFDTIEELLKIPFVGSWADNHEFHQFSQNDTYEYQNGHRYTLLAELDGGKVWYVVGYLKEPIAGMSVWDHGVAAYGY